MTLVQIEVIQAYRLLYRNGLHAIQYASPARHTLKYQLRQAFRKGRIEELDPQKIANTVHFLNCAARETGLEHRILKALLHVRWWDIQLGKRRSECVSPRYTSLLHVLLYLTNAI